MQSYQLSCYNVLQLNCNHIANSFLVYFLVLVVSTCFEDRMLFVPEADRVAVVTINISTPLSTDTTLTVASMDVTATGQ